MRLHASGEMDAVLKTSQVPALISAVNEVAARIDRQWAADGEEYLRTTNLAQAPDPNDPAVQHDRRIQDLELHSMIADKWSDIATLVAEAENTDDAIERIAAHLGVDEIQVLVRLSRFSLFTLTRGAREARARTLDELRDTPAT